VCSDRGISSARVGVGDRGSLVGGLEASAILAGQKGKIVAVLTELCTKL
jgi:hypothetical protein